MFEANAPSSSQRRVVRPALPACGDDIVSVRSSACWIGRTQAPCFSCVQFSNVVGLFFPADSAIGRGERESLRPVSASDEIKYFQLIFVQRIHAPTLEDVLHFYCEDIEHLYEDYDVRLDDRYVMNHCHHCGARFSDSKLFERPGGLFNHHNPARRSRIAMRRCTVPIAATGCMAPIADHLVTAIEAASRERIALPA